MAREEGPDDAPEETFARIVAGETAEGEAVAEESGRRRGLFRRRKAEREDTPPEEEPEAGGDDEGDTSRVSGWGRVFRGNKPLWIGAVIAVVCLVAGLLVGQFVLAPADAHSEAPDPGLVTAPVDFGPLSNDVTLRADVGYADAVEVSIDTSSISGAAVVTGQVPAVGTEFYPLSVALEVTGRPVIVLPGELPAYRTLRVGVSGPDVTQLKQALASMGIDPGDTNSNLFDQATANAVAQLYAQSGYPAPPAPEGAEESLRSAQSGVRAAEESVARAQTALDKAGAGPSSVQVQEADSAVADAEQQLGAARQRLAWAEADKDAERILTAQTEVQTATSQLNNAIAARDALWAGVDASAEQAELNAAQQQLTDANEALSQAQEDVLPYLPASEVLFLTELPRRVDAVTATRGSVLQGAAMTVSGATVRLTGAAAEADTRLLKVGDAGTFDLPDGTEHRAVISALNPGKDDKKRWEVLFEPDPLTAEQIQQLQGSNVRVRIEVGATEGDVLSVPLAALTAGPGGESRVEVVDGDPRDGEDAKTRMVQVKTGLAAEGAVEVEPVEGTLEEGDLVVVGR